MQISATDALMDRRTIADAVVLRIQYPDDTGGFYAVPRDEVEDKSTTCRDHFNATVDVLEPGEALRRFKDGTWIGIELASAHGVGAWGRALIEEVRP